ncbi:hypothetical protein MY04_5393 [Flammeovirga sp. MY04]|uniref:hypothetical protein n=1 Tax=Flammeovirga sp. MY04 TaxID=1191459 RepID=UPI0013050E49|nr:hypothetical protein [Flammeovirga sp. MY04]ANQ52725.2 hypothetical protein MY04_5393 [Flammeovirga sp. MY04]
MKKIITNILAALCLTSCLTEHDVDFSLPQNQPESLLYHKNDEVRPVTIAFEGEAPETMAEGDLTFELSKVSVQQDTILAVVEDSLNPFEIDPITGVIKYVPNDSTQLGQYLLDVSLSNEAGETAFNNAYRTVLEDWRPLIHLNSKGSDTDVVFLIDEDGNPISSTITDLFVETVRSPLDSIQISVTPELPEGTKLLLNSFGQFYFTGKLENQMYEVSLFTSNEYGDIEAPVTFALTTQVVFTEERQLFDMELTINYKPDGLGEFEFEGMLYKQISGPTIGETATWWNINRERNNHPDQDRRENFITRCYARTISGSSKAEHIMVPLQSFDAVNLKSVTVETGVLFNAGVGINGLQRIEVRVVGEAEYQLALERNDFESRVNQWPLIYSTAEHQREASGWYFKHNIKEQGVSIDDDTQMRVVALIRHLDDSNSGYMGLDQLTISGKYLILE